MFFLSGVKFFIFLDLCHNWVFKCFLLFQLEDVFFNLLLLILVMSQHNWAVLNAHIFALAIESSRVMDFEEYLD